MSDKIFINGLRVFGYHGVNRIEREHGQHFVVDIEARLDLREAGTTDLLGSTLDYDSIIKKVQNVIAHERFTLIEALAERISEVILENPEVYATTIRVAKPKPPIEADLESVQVEIQRGR